MDVMCRFPKGVCVRVRCTRVGISWARPWALRRFCALRLCLRAPLLNLPPVARDMGIPITARRL